MPLAGCPAYIRYNEPIAQTIQGGEGGTNSGRDRREPSVSNSVSLYSTEVYLDVMLWILISDENVNIPSEETATNTVASKAVLTPGYWTAGVDCLGADDIEIRTFTSKRHAPTAKHY